MPCVMQVMYICNGGGRGGGGGAECHNIKYPGPLSQRERTKHVDSKHAFKICW